jgi:ACS family tartrate transporter-like MFS transporter
VLPFVCAAIGILVIARLSRVAKERRYLVIAVAGMAAVGLTIVVIFRGSPGVAMLGLCLAGIGVFAYLPPFWAMATTGISRAQAAVGVAVVNSIGNLGGFAGPYLVGQGANASGVTAGLFVPIGAELLAVVLLLAWRSPRPPTRRARPRPGSAPDRHGLIVVSGDSRRPWLRESPGSAITGRAGGPRRCR